MPQARVMFSDEFTEWHLTPRGWESGTKRIDVAGDTVKPRPADAVLTFRYRERVTVMGESTSTDCDEEWRSADPALVARLLAKFGPCPERL